MKSYDVTIQTKPLSLYLTHGAICFSVFDKMKLEIWSKFTLARFGSERVNGVKMKHTIMTVTLDA